MNIKLKFKVNQNRKPFKCLDSFKEAHDYAIKRLGDKDDIFFIDVYDGKRKIDPRLFNKYENACDVYDKTNKPLTEEQANRIQRYFEQWAELYRLADKSMAFVHKLRAKYGWDYETKRTPYEIRRERFLDAKIEDMHEKIDSFINA